MKEQTIYVADDGSRWDTPEAARDREALCLAVADALSPLGTRPNLPGCEFENGGGYLQHYPETIAIAKRRLIKLSRHFIGEWMTSQERDHHKDLMTAHPSWFARMMDGCRDSQPLEDAWGRLCMIDAQGREWGQPYYASHPEQGEQREIKTTEARCSDDGH